MVEEINVLRAKTTLYVCICNELDCDPLHFMNDRANTIVRIVRPDKLLDNYDMGNNIWKHFGRI